jgi:hypothetical protein
VAEDETTRSIHLLKIDGYHPSNATTIDSKYHVKSRCVVDWYEWEIRFYPAGWHGTLGSSTLELVFLGKARANKVITAKLSGRLVDPSGVLQPSAETIGPVRIVPASFRFFSSIFFS